MAFSLWETLQYCWETTISSDERGMSMIKNVCENCDACHLYKWCLLEVLEHIFDQVERESYVGQKAVQSSWGKAILSIVKHIEVVFQLRCELGNDCIDCID